MELLLIIIIIILGKAYVAVLLGLVPLMTGKKAASLLGIVGLVVVTGGKFVARGIHLRGVHGLLGDMVVFWMDVGRNTFRQYVSVSFPLHWSRVDLPLVRVL